MSSRAKSIQTEPLILGLEEMYKRVKPAKKLGLDEDVVILDSNKSLFIQFHTVKMDGVEKKGWFSDPHREATEKAVLLYSPVRALYSRYRQPRPGPTLPNPNLS